MIADTGTIPNLATIYNEPVKALTNWFDNNIQPLIDKGHASKLRLSFSLDADAIVSITFDGVKYSDLWQGVTLRRKCLWIMDVPVVNSDIFNIYCSVECNVIKCQIDEIMMEG